MSDSSQANRLSLRLAPESIEALAVRLAQLLATAAAARGPGADLGGRGGEDVVGSPVAGSTTMPPSSVPGASDRGRGRACGSTLIEVAERLGRRRR